MKKFDIQLQLLTHKNVCELLEVSDSTLRRMVQRGEINQPQNITKRTVRYKYSDIQHLVTKIFGVENAA